MNVIEIKKDYAIIHITGNKIDGDIIIDIEDVEKIKNHSWYIKEGVNQYVAAKINNKTIKLHRFLLNITDRKNIVDHIDGNTFNNRKSNLRITNHCNNNLNCKFSKNNSSGRTGVYKIKGRNGRSDAWVAEGRKENKDKKISFSIDKYGNEEAFKLACEAREKWENENNVLTAKTFNDYRNESSNTPDSK